jgi:hypothetical protein
MAEDNVIYGKNGLPYDPHIQDAIKTAKRSGKRIPAAVKRAMDEHDAPEGTKSTVKPKAVAPYSPPAKETPEEKPHIIGDPTKNTKPKGAKNPTPRSERVYPPSGRRGSGNAKRAQSDPNLRVGGAEDLTDLGGPDAMRGGKVKSGGFVSPGRKTAPKPGTPAPAETQRFRVRQSGPSTSINLPEHHQDISNVIRVLHDATKGMTSDESQQAAVRNTLDKASSRLRSSAVFHNDGDPTSAVAEMTAAVGHLTTAGRVLSRHPGVRASMSNPEFNNLNYITSGAEDTLYRYQDSIGR